LYTMHWYLVIKLHGTEFWTEVLENGQGCTNVDFKVALIEE